MTAKDLRSLMERTPPFIVQAIALAAAPPWVQSFYLEAARRARIEDEERAREERYRTFVLGDWGDSSG